MKPDLRLAYEKADYVAGGVPFHIGTLCPDLKVATTAAYITAFNPHSKVQSPEKNQLAHARLQGLVAGYATQPAESRDPVKQFPPEKGLLIHGIQRAEAMAIGRILEQNAIVFIEQSRPPELVVL